MIGEFALEESTAVLAAAVDADLDWEQVRQECLARANLYRILAGAFAQEPAVEFLAALREPSLLESLRGAGIAFDADFLVPDLQSLAEALACEYTTLFASPGGFAPVESVRLTGRFKQEPHFQVAEIYKRLGFEQTTARFEAFPDQLGVELMFVAALLERAAAALQSQDVAAYRNLDKEIRRFWVLHLGRWVRGYSGLVERATTHSFYREMARFLAGFATEEIAAMGLHLDDLDRGRMEVPKAEIKMEFDPNEPVCGECPPELAPREAGKGAQRVIPIAALDDLQLRE